MSANLFTAQQPVTLEDKHTPFVRPLHAQPDNRVTKAVSASGAARAEFNYIIQEKNKAPGISTVLATKLFSNTC